MAITSPPASPTTRRRPRAVPPGSSRPSLAPLWLLSPAGLVLLCVTIAPIVFLIFISFTDYNQRSLFTGEFTVVGLAQYVTIVGDPEFWLIGTFSESIWRQHRSRQAARRAREGSRAVR